MLKEFKEFALKGNVVDMAVGIIVGAAFGKIVSSMVGDIIMPVIGLLTGGVNFSHLFFSLSGDYANLAEAEKAGAAVIKYGAFIQYVFDFTIVSFVLFMLIKQMNRLKKTEEAAPAAPPKQEVLLEEIRDLLKKR